jgi:hypothetical protein
MLGNNSYYFGTTRKYVIAFGSLFSDITIQRLDASGTRIQTIAVPISYSPKEAILVRLKDDPNLEKPVAITLPRIGFEISSFTYDGTRKLSSTIKNKQITSDNDMMKSQYVPAPYNISFTLSIFVRNADDGAQILEQILPHFRPEFTMNVRLVPEMDIVVDTPVILDQVSIEDTYNTNFETRRALVYVLNFTLKAQIPGPTSTSGVIKRAITNFHQDIPLTTPTVQRITLTPSLYANGSPLFSPSANASLSVPVSSIGSNTDFGFSIDINDNIYEIN